MAFLTREDKERLLNQRAKAIWLTGLPGSGKTTIAAGLEQRLARMGFFTRVLDGDIMRKGICSDLGFSIEDRFENIRRIAEMNKLFLQNGIITINAFISPTERIRELARGTIGVDHYVEVYIHASLEECIKRDPKGLYRKAMAGNILNFTGLDAPYEPPVNPDVVIDTEKTTEDQSIEIALEHIIQRIAYRQL